MLKYKIIGISKNFISSTDHLSIPYFILLLKNKEKYFIKKTFEEYEIGDYFLDGKVINSRAC